MGFDLTTFCVQIVNLFLLIWLLKRFLYRPVLDIIEKRRQQVADTILEADHKLSNATQLEKDLEQRHANFEKQRQKRLDELDKDILQQKTQMTKELELDYCAKREKLQDELNQSWHTAEESIQNMIAKEFMVLSEKILSEWSSQTSMDQVLTLFRNKIISLPKSKRNELQKLLNSEKLILVATSEQLTKQQQDTVRGILSQNFALLPNARIQFKKRTELLLGMELRVANFLLDWNLNTYLNDMRERLKNNIATLIMSTKRKADK